ncbi:hypothetical protein FDT66_04720 [Polaribacter aestuariivivens]|uniref:Lipoprotein n=1 Tax=Polaribacter aestuariivivens TaxID=2304626 RepID=A0A5S3N7B5_9FLAO|nr:hypothetical protein [Polaribacter aestuariivivens]TMM31278.1 hypothetical protein FDT66_04720 [Polaribacter aestuariivivens]
MKKIILLLLTLSFFSCQSQNNSNNSRAIQKDSIVPETKIKVHKQYDENGNLVRIDSTYTSFYSNIKGDSILEKSSFKNFKNNFDEQFNLNNSFFRNHFFQDSLFMKNDFYTDDFFKNNFKSHQQQIDRMLKKMDSLKNDFYKKQKIK